MPYRDIQAARKHAREYNRSAYLKDSQPILQRQHRGRQKRRELIDQIKSVPCADCGHSFPPCCMDFDHRPGEQKTLTLGAAAYGKLSEVLAEISKCDIICSNCHRIRTRDRGWAWANRKGEARG